MQSRPVDTTRERQVRSERAEASGAEPQTTNLRMEVRSEIEGVVIRSCSTMTACT